MCPCLICAVCWGRDSGSRVGQFTRLNKWKGPELCSCHFILLGIKKAAEPVRYPPLATLGSGTPHYLQHSHLAMFGSGTPPYLQHSHLAMFGSGTPPYLQHSHLAMFGSGTPRYLQPVSYTHLTLPTNAEV